jgi:PST family polysaccharide transporter
MNQAERFRELICTREVKANLRARSVRAAGLTWAAGSGDFALRIASTAVLARLILPADFGLVMMVTAITSIADQLRDLGLSTATVQKEDIGHQEVSNLFWINVSVGAFITLAVCGAAPIIAAYYREPRLIPITCLLATNFIFGGLMVQHQALLTRQLRLGQISSTRLASSLISTLVAVVLAWMGFGFWALVWREVVRCALLTIGIWVFFPWIPGLPDRKTEIRGLLGFGANLTGANLVASFSSGFDRILLGRFWGPSPVAMYRQAYQLLVVPTDQLLSPMYLVTQPGLSMLQSEAGRYRRFYRKVLMLACFVTMPLSMFVAVYAPEITRVVLGNKWGDSAPLLVILSFDTFIKQAVGSAAFILITRNRSRTYLMLTLLHNAALIVFMSIGVRWGPKGVALGDVAATYLLIAPRLHYSFKGSPFTVGMFFSAIAQPAIASLGMAAALIPLRLATSSLPATPSLALGALAAAVLFPTVWLLMPGGKNELLDLFSDLRSVVRRKSGSGSEPVVVSS